MTSLPVPPATGRGPIIGVPAGGVRIIVFGRAISSEGRLYVGIRCATGTPTRHRLPARMCTNRSTGRCVKKIVGSDHRPRGIDEREIGQIGVLFRHGPVEILLRHEIVRDEPVCSGRSWHQNACRHKKSRQARLSGRGDHARPCPILHCRDSLHMIRSPALHILWRLPHSSEHKL